MNHARVVIDGRSAPRALSMRVLWAPPRERGEEYPASCV